EVYGLHMLFVSVITWLFVSAMHEDASSLRVMPPTVNSRSASRFWLVFVYATGLGLSNHMMTVLPAPAFLWLYFSVHGVGSTAWHQMLKAAPLFLLGLSAYLYLPLRAAVSPVANWGNPASPHEFWLHVSARQYKAMMFSGLDVPLQKLALLIERLPGV